MEDSTVTWFFNYRAVITQAWIKHFISRCLHNYIPISRTTKNKFYICSPQNIDLRMTTYIGISISDFEVKCEIFCGHEQTYMLPPCEERTTTRIIVQPIIIRSGQMVFTNIIVKSTTYPTYYRKHTIFN